MTSPRHSRRLFVSIGATIVATVVVVAAPQQGGQRESRERHVFASVVDKNSAPVPGLGTADFALAEDGVTREILRVSTATAPMQIALLLDNSAAVDALVPDLRKAASTFVQRILEANAANEISVMTFGERPVTESTFTSSSIPLLRATGGLLSRSGSGAYMLQAIPDACKALTKHGATRPVIVAFTSEEGPEFSDNRHARVIESLKAAGATLWTLAYQPPGPARFENTPEGRERMEVLNTVAVDTGGENKVILAPTGLDAAFRSVAAMLTSDNDVTYSRPVTLVPPHKLALSVKRPGVRLFAPRWAAQ